MQVIRSLAQFGHVITEKQYTLSILRQEQDVCNLAKQFGESIKIYCYH